MPCYEYECEVGHRFERIVQVRSDEPKEIVKCDMGICSHIARLVPSKTGKPILKAGKVGGFYAPTRP